MSDASFHRHGMGSADAEVPTSLILCTRNGGARLGTCLDHLAALDAPADFEIVLVDNGSDDGSSRQRLADFAAEPRHRARLVDCTRPGNGAGRNEALKHARGELILFIDDDCYAWPDLVRAWREVFRTFDVGYASGMVREHDKRYAFLGCKMNPDRELVDAHAFVRPGFLMGSNMAFRRTCLERIGGFDERFGAGVRFAGEDWDLALRASKAGFAGGYFPEPKVNHDHRREVGEALKRLHFYDYGNGAVFAKHLRDAFSLRLVFEFGWEFLRCTRMPGRTRKLLGGFFDFQREPAMASA
jgi:hypothetical protein